MVDQDGVKTSSFGILCKFDLLFKLSPHLKFNNLTLISTHGLPGKQILGKKHKQFLMNSHCFNDDDYALMSLSSWINVVVGKMTGIDRSAKHVIVSKEKKVPYDHLILCTGQQYQVPGPSGADIRKLPTNREVFQNCKQKYTGVVPSNLFILSDEEDCLLAMNWVKEKLIGSPEGHPLWHLKESPECHIPGGQVPLHLVCMWRNYRKHLHFGNVIVYGNKSDVYTTVETLVSLGISGSRIHLVHPPLQSNVTAINNNAIEKAVDKALSQAGVSVHHDSLLAQWNEGNHPDPIVQASFTTKTKPFKLQCSSHPYNNIYIRKGVTNSFSAQTSRRKLCFLISSKKDTMVDTILFWN
ncbi:UNVERIFIED_CONTAM: hypothetical protein K2H54_013491 [Gekko kuhli]